VTGGALLIAGTTSDAGKSMVVAGLCRLLARRGIRVAPFKAQNMSNNSCVAFDAEGVGGEIGRAQGMQARAAGLAPSVRFNPVLLKPGSDRTSQLLVRGRPIGYVSAIDYITHREHLAGVVAEELAGLRTEFDVVICEGAGSPAEINLRATDLANMGLARSADLPVIVVGDIDRGGVLAHLFGTVAVLSPEDQLLVAGFIINKFRGDPALLKPGMDQLAALTGRATYGVLPYSDGLWLDAEDSLSVVAGEIVGVPAPPHGPQALRVGAIRLPRISNSTDIEALACEPGVLVRWVSEPADLADVDVIIIPGSKSTVADLGWLRERGLADAIVAHDGVVLGICGGFQMLCRRIEDTIESGCGTVEGLGLLDADIVFFDEKELRRWDVPLSGYEIHHGQVVRCADAGWFEVDGIAQGYRRNRAFGTHWHGLLDNDDFRRDWLTTAAAATGRSGFHVAPDVSVPARRDAQLDVMADLLTAHLDLDAVLGLLDGPPPARPTIISALGRQH
jgi:adenosylcobyric acid synthase